MTERLSDERLLGLAGVDPWPSCAEAHAMASELIELRKFREDVFIMLKKLQQLWDSGDDVHVGKMVIACITTGVHHSPLADRIRSELLKATKS